MDKATNKPLVENGESVTASKTFTAAAAEGFEILIFTIKGETLQGTETVVFEDLMFEGRKIASHADIEDEDQTVERIIPNVKTTATDKGR